MASAREPVGTLLLAGCVLVFLTVVAFAVRDALAGDASVAVRYLVVGWIPYTLVFVLAGRLLSSPGSLPSMRASDLGLGLVLVALLVSLGLDAWGISPESVPAAHVLQAGAIFLGLALFGWGIGRRSRALEQV